MSSVPCPNCRKPLNVPDSLRSSQVQCPHCQAVFNTPVVLGVKEKPVLLEPADPPIAPPTRRSEGDLEAAEEEFRSRRRWEIYCKTKAAAQWMRFGAVLELVFSPCCFLAGFSDFLVPLGAGGKAFELLVAVMLLLGGGLNVVLSVLTFLGAQSLAAQKSFPLALTGSILSLVLAIKSPIQVTAAGMGIYEALNSGALVLFPIAGSAFFLMLGAIAGHLIGGIRGLIVLADQEVRQSFQ